MSSIAIILIIGIAWISGIVILSKVIEYILRRLGQ